MCSTVSPCSHYKSFIAFIDSRFTSWVCCPLNMCISGSDTESAHKISHYNLFKFNIFQQSYIRSISSSDTALSACLMWVALQIR